MQCMEHTVKCLEEQQDEFDFKYQTHNMEGELILCICDNRFSRGYRQIWYCIFFPKAHMAMKSPFSFVMDVSYEVTFYWVTSVTSFYCSWFVDLTITQALVHRHHQRGREDGTDEGAAGSTQQTGHLQEGTTHNPLVYITLNNLRLRHSPNNKLGHYEVYYSYNMYFLWFSLLPLPFLLPSPL